MDEDRMLGFLDRVVVDSGAAFAGLSTSIGARLGLYEALSGAGPLTAAEPARRTALTEVDVAECLALHVASEYVEYDPRNRTYYLPDEHAAVLADPNSPELFEGVATFFRPGYAASLVQEWLPALEGVVAKLERGAMVDDVGCGLGYSTMLMARGTNRIYEVKR
jgi:hypothetical protein